MKVCDLTNGKTLQADYAGEPFITHAPHGMRPAGWTTEVIYIAPEDAALVDKWLRNPDNDCLRARGDYRWQAACRYMQRV